MAPKMDPLEHASGCSRRPPPAARSRPQAGQRRPPAPACRLASPGQPARASGGGLAQAEAWPRASQERGRRLGPSARAAPAPGEALAVPRATGCHVSNLLFGKFLSRLCRIDRAEF